MTKGQLLGMYWETVRWEARYKSMMIRINRLSAGEGEEVQRQIDAIEDQANPYDPEDTEDFSAQGLAILLKSKEL